MYRVLLVRPGWTDYDEQGRIKGRLDIPLNENGRNQLNEMLREIGEVKIRSIYTAPCQVATETAEALAERVGSKVKQVTGLQNLDPGLWQGKLIEEVKNRHPKIYKRWQEQPETMCPPEGEMLSEVRTRLNAFLEKVSKRAQDGVIALIAPEPVASVLCALLKQQELGDLWQAETNCGQWEWIDVRPASPVAP